MTKNLITIVGAALTGTLAPYVEQVEKMSVPDVVMQLFQIGAWTAAMVVGFVAFMKWKNKKK